MSILFGNYTQLVAAIGSQLNRDDLADAVPGWITMCEADLNTRLRVREMLVRSELVIDDEYVTLPTDFAATRSILLNVTPKVRLGFKTIDEAEELAMTRYRAPGKPENYTVVGVEYQFLPQPDTEYTARLLYYQRIPSLDAETQTSNWLLARFPQLYFYGSLVHSAPYLKEDERIRTWAGLYESAINTLNRGDDLAQTATNGLVASAQGF